MKRILSLALSLIMTVNVCAVTIGSTITAYGATDYATQLKNKGFPESYINDLVSLHKKYPNWIFTPLKTNLDWKTAVNGERSRHKNQLIEKNSSNSTDMYCSCSNCYKNGAYVIQEASNWVSASQKAVEYYMDPRNWLNEKGIFQFESTEYDGTQTRAGVESILSGTWMADSLIRYKTTEGNTVTYTHSNYPNGIKYSDAILRVASESGMSAYYLASKIRQENGGATASATAVNGTSSPFQGIYNYYNIGANTGAKDGLAWAAGYLQSNKKTTLYSTYDSEKKVAGGTKTTLPTKQYMTYIGKYGNYYKVRLYNESPYKEGAIGYVLISDLRTKYFNHGRPWINPYRSIYYGAKYIYDKFSTQTSGYLQKFNVNPASNELFGHEYMANVAAASAESTTTYYAYKNANILPITKTFVIPVFNNMPTNSSGSTTTNTTNPNFVDKVGLKTTVIPSPTQIRVYWGKVKNATGYQITWARDSSFKNIITTTNVSGGSTTSYTGNNFTKGNTYYIRVRALKKTTSKTYYGAWSGTRAVKYSAVTTPSSLTSSGTTSTSVTAKWTKVSGVTGYQLMVYKNGAWQQAAWISTNTNTYKVSSLASGTQHSFKVRAFVEKNGVRNYSGWRSGKQYTKSGTPSISLSCPKSTQIKVSWPKVSGGVSGYQISWSRNKDFSSIIATTNLSYKSTSYTGKNFTKGNTYYIRVRSYLTINNKKYYGAWSTAKSIKCK